MFTGLIIALVGIVCYKLGWVAAHQTIAKECKKLGGFYVDKEVFKCVKVESIESKAEVEKKVELNKS